MNKRSSRGADAEWQLGKAKPVRHHDKRKGGYQPGSFKRVCDRSGFIYDAKDTRKEWTGLIVGKDEWDYRHPQEFVRGLPEHIAVREARPGSPFQVDSGFDIDDLTAVSGSVAASVYTSGSVTSARPFVFWKVDFTAEIDIHTVTLSGLVLSGSPDQEIRQGLFIGLSDDDSTYTNLDEYVNEFGGGVSTGAVDYTINVSDSARYLRLALVGGKGTGYTGALSMTGFSALKGN